MLAKPIRISAMASALLVVLMCSMATFLVFPSLAASNSTDLPPPVLDVNGQNLIPGEKYYVLPVFRGRGGGLTIGDRGDKCPLYVSQANFELQQGLPMTFAPVNPDDEFVRVSTDLNVHVSDVSTVWKLSGPDESTGVRYVSIDGDKSNPGEVTLSNWFKIERRSEDVEERFDYKFVFCPTVCETCRPVCGDLGVFFEEHKRWLAMTYDHPFFVKFAPANYWAVQGTL